MSQTQHKFLKRFQSGSRENQALAFLRVTTGLFFLYQGLQKLKEGSHFTQALPGILHHWAVTNPLVWYKSFLLQGVIPHAPLFAQLVIFGEIAVGVSFLLGFFIRFSGPCAVLMNLSYLLASQQTGPAALGVNLAFILISMSLFWGNAGHYCGLDQFIQYKNPSRPKVKAHRASIQSSRKSSKAKETTPTH